ncbi:MAG: type II toxin-antitoxin system Phd/YefM family antitoxin [Desulfuromonadales bacterium]|uniref:type II toxin-antitoxin system Phd/YefM family antitoxin n=1 Tax=Desulfuromonas sp. KJ2020 TaxID=2919173 RepID=UPI0020A79BE4|nr:type II toxin-antitoxin system Phd/YefM family antitoxin [Desulfuromonas sp. KJ2020]MCP3176397.1 type II toxin-antitoxin system Phd/YefM family antitoxin [Desulfuromonas sp. KJ2020]
MPITSKDIVPLKEMRARLTELADEACAGREKIITRNGKAYVALIDARRLDYYHRLERENIHLGLLDEAARGWDDVEEGNLLTVAELKSRYSRGK